MELLFRKHFVLFALGFLYSISLVAPQAKWFDWFNKYTYDPVQLERAEFNQNCTSCPFVYFPVCGDDNKTYLNECKLACKNAEKAVKVNMSRTGPCRLFPD